jgi:hypothetical protein
MSALISPDDLALRVGSAVDWERAALACDLASAEVRAITGQTISAATHVATLEVSPGRLPVVRWPVGHTCASWSRLPGVAVLPERPVTSITSVATYGVDLDADGWWWDGVSTSLYLADIETPTVTVEYAAGFTPVPDEVKAAALALAAAAYSNPAGLTSEGIGDYQVSYADTSGPGTVARVHSILSRYTVRAGTITPRD